MDASTSSRKCTSCGDDSVVSDAHAGQEQMVCTNCGVIQSEGSYQSEKPEFSSEKTYNASSTLPYNITRYNRPRGLTKVQKAAKDRLLDMVSVFKFSPTMKEEALKLFSDACKHSAFHCVGELKKIILAGCCIYTVIRLYGIAIGLSSVANYLNIPLQDMGTIFSDLKSAFSLQIVSPDVEEVIDVFLKDTLFDQNQKMDLATRMQKILHITKQTLLSTGVSFRPLLSATCYISWCSLQKKAARKCMSFKPFCQKYGCYFTNTNYKRLDELLKMLTLFCQGLPWAANEEVTKKHIFLQLDTVLKFSYTLARENEPILETCTSRRKKQKTDNERGPDVTPHHIQISDSTELDENDIPDEDMPNYIRTPEEIAYIQKIVNRN